MTKDQPEQSELEKIVQSIEVNSAIALHRSMLDGDPKHHKEMIDKAVKSIESYTKTQVEQAVIKARIKEHQNLWEVLPGDAEHVGTVKDVSALMVTKLESELHSSDVEYCNWTFKECLAESNKWLVERDCGDEIELYRGYSKNWKAYKRSLEPTHQFYPPPYNSKCPNCGKYINGVNPYDDGETWRK